MHGRLGAADDLLGPAPLFRLRGKHRRRLLVKSERRHAAVESVRDAVRTAVRDRALREVAISVDGVLRVEVADHWVGTLASFEIP